MVIILASSLVAILDQWIASKVVLWSVGNARPIPIHLDIIMRAPSSQIVCLSCIHGELYFVSWVGQVRGDK
jgi:hypothetical protein